MSADSYTISITGTSNNTDLILESASANILDGGTNTIQQTIVADPTISNDYDVNNLGEIRTPLGDTVHNIFDLECSSKYPWTKALKQFWNTNKLGNYMSLYTNPGALTDEEKLEYPQLFAESGQHYFSRNTRDESSKHSLFTGVASSNFIEIDLDNYPHKRSYVNFAECLNRESVRQKTKGFGFGPGVEPKMLSEYPNAYISPSVIKSSSNQMIMSPDKKVLYVHFGGFMIDLSYQMYAVDQSLMPNEKSEITMILGFALDENEQLDPSGTITSDPIKGLQELHSRNEEKDFNVIRKGNKDIVCMYLNVRGVGCLLYKYEFTRDDKVITNTVFKHTKEIIPTGVQTIRAWEMGYCEVYDRYIMNVRFEEGGVNNMLFYSVDANFETNDGHVGEIQCPGVENSESDYAKQVLEEIGGVESKGITWADAFLFYNTSRMTVYGGKVYMFFNLLRVIDSNFGMDFSLNLPKLSYLKDFNFPSTAACTGTGGLNGYKVDTVNNVLLFQMFLGGFSSGQLLNGNSTNDNPGRSTSLSIVLPINETVKSDPKTWKVKVVADRTSYCETMMNSISVFDDKGHVYLPGGWLNNSANPNYNVCKGEPLRPLFMDDEGNAIDFWKSGLNPKYNDIDYNRAYYHSIKKTKPPQSQEDIMNMWLQKRNVLGLENNRSKVTASTKLTEDGMRITDNNLVNVEYNMNGIDMTHNGKNLISAKVSEDAMLHLKSSTRNTLVGSKLMRDADNRYGHEQKDNVMIGCGLGNNINSVNNVIIGNDILNNFELKDVFAVGTNEKILLGGDLSNQTLMFNNNNFDTAILSSTKSFPSENNLDTLYTSFGIVAGYGLNKFDMPRELVSQLDKLTNKINELVVAVNASTNSNIEPTSMGPSGIKKLDVELLIDINFDGWSSEVYGEIITNNSGKQLTIQGGSIAQTSISSLNPLSFTGSTPLTDSAANANYGLYKFPLEMDVDNNIALIYWSDEYGDLASHTHIVLEDKFKYMDFPHAAYSPNFVLPVFAENTPTGNELTVAMLRVINTNKATPAGGQMSLSDNIIITTACELTNTNSKLNQFSDDSIVKKVSEFGPRIGFNMSLDNTPGSGIGPFYPVVKFNFETTNSDGTIKNWAPMTVDSAIREWFKDGETYSGFGFFAGHRKGHMFNIADCVDKASVKVCILDGEEAEDTVVPGSEVLFAPHIEGEVGPDATWDQRFNSALNLTGGSFWADNNITYKTTEYGVTNTQMRQLLQNGNPGGYYRDFAVWNPLVMLVHMPQSTWGQTYVIKLDVDLTPYGLRKEHIEMRFVADSY